MTPSQASEIRRLSQEVVTAAVKYQMTPWNHKSKTYRATELLQARQIFYSYLCYITQTNEG